MKIAVGMSGGVDSTVATALLLAGGHEVTGLTMRIWDGSVDLPAATRTSCYGPDEEQEIEAVRGIAGRLGIRHHTIPLISEYKEQVLDYFRREYLSGRTPNPCVRCNHAIKFGALWSAARRAGIAFDAFATGHYARVIHDAASGRHLLRRARDTAKDQTYFLARLTQEQLAGVIFPLGDWHKQHVREAAREMGMGDLAEQAESQDFIGHGDYTALFKETTIEPGPILDRRGNIVGRHQGIARYTIGQRKGLDLGGNPEPYYVTAMDVKRNALIVGPRAELLSPGLVATDINWIGLERLDSPLSVAVRIRSCSPAIPAVIAPVEGAAPSTVKVIFNNPQTAVTPGQAAVFYQDDIVLGGGWIEKALEQKKGQSGNHESSNEHL